MAMRDRERGTVFWSFGYPENIDQTHQTDTLLAYGKIKKTKKFLFNTPSYIIIRVYYI